MTICFVAKTICNVSILILLVLAVGCFVMDVVEMRRKR